MPKFTKWSLIIGAGLSLFALPPGIVRADDAAKDAAAKEAREDSRPLAFPAGFKVKEGAPAGGIKTGLAKLTERALTKGDFNSMLAELSKQDRERVREFKNVDHAKLDFQISRFRETFKQKYGKDFDPDGKVAFGAPLLIFEGEVTDSAVALNNWPLPASPDKAVTASSKVPAGNEKELKKEIKEEKLQKGRNVAIIRFPASHGLPDVTVSMVHHLPGFWRVDIPNDRTGEQLYNDLLTHITMMNDHADKWPAEIHEAYRAAGHHIAAAMYGVNHVPAAKG